ncbi:MAG: GNAT family N-acetyltransferase [Arachidicoccus sp.]|nr:GNAT family N-acetyltransferase [Arachidicoccus sp.]
MKIEFKFLEEDKSQKIISFFQLLSKDASIGILENRLKEMFQAGYKCIGIFDGDNIIGISGLWILVKYYVGKHIEPDNVVVLPEYRNKGVGNLLMQWIYNYAKETDCVASELNCYVTNSSGQKFWANQGYKIIGFHYQKLL